MRLADFDYHLPADRIAQTPVVPRDASRLLVDRGAEPAEHRHVSDLTMLLQSGDLLVVNETKVIPARLPLRRGTGGAAEVLMLEPLDGERRVWEALIRPARKLQRGETLYSAGGDAVIEIGERSAAGDTFTVVLVGSTGDLFDAFGLLDEFGEMPLPPYITERLADPDRYQTVYASEPGSAAAPTAGLHFTPELLSELEAHGVEQATVELVVGLDTFRPIHVDDPLQHRMHTERYRVPADTMERCRAARRVVAVGTTSVRALESAAARHELDGRTDLFIHRGFDWQIVDLMMTNFHLPRTTLLMMIDAFVGDRWHTLYEIALAEQYRFLSFGDAMLLDRQPEKRSR